MRRIIRSLAKNYPTPFYFYDLDLLNENLRKASLAANKYSYTIHYSIKANNNLPVLKLVNNAGFGADCVSANEIKLALKAGFSAKDIVFAGVGKTDDELIYAIKNNIFSINVESIQELEVINFLASKMGKKPTVALRINPEINAKSHQYLTTGTINNKFGIPLADIKNLIANPDKYKNVDICGLHFHIGSQITDLSIFEKLAKSANYFNHLFRQNNFKIKHLNMGGGLGIDYYYPKENKYSAFEAYFETFNKNLQLFEGQKVHFELGRSIVAQSGFLITKVLYTKQSEVKNFAVVDAGMNDLIRPALYNSYHYLENISSEGNMQHYDVVGPICESSDFLADNIKLASCHRNDVLMVYSAGAYGQVMASNYNMRTIPGAYYFYKNKLFISAKSKRLQKIIHKVS